ncbi:MAG: MgtC/SapB family protein [Candidatus Njordarchaeia archaeon]|nr:MgtC/SapB family protein [Candidatus Korarchaeota archaeon]
MDILNASLQEPIQLILGFVVGAIIGLERQFYEVVEKESETSGEAKPGVRSFGLLSILGTISIIEGKRFGLEFLFYLTFVAVIIIIGIYTFARQRKGDIGITTSISMVLSFFSGALVGLGEITIAIALSVFTTSILASKGFVLEILKSLEYREIRSALEIGLFVFLLLPIVPDVSDPLLNAINLRTLYIFAVTVLFLSFFAYVIVRRLGAKQGMMTFSALGSIINSEAVAMNLMRFYGKTREKLVDDGENSRLLELVASISNGVLVANSVMLLRTIFLITIFGYNSLELIFRIFICLVIPAGIGILYAYLATPKNNLQPGIKVSMTSPLSYGTAIKYVLALTLITYFTVIFYRLFSDAGFLISSIAGGFVSNTAIVLSALSLYVNGEVSIFQTELAIIGGSISAVINKIFYTKISGADKTIFSKVIKDCLVTVFLILLGFLISQFIYQSIGDLFV